MTRPPGPNQAGGIGMCFNVFHVFRSTCCFHQPVGMSSLTQTASYLVKMPSVINSSQRDQQIAQHPTMLGNVVHRPWSTVNAADSLHLKIDGSKFQTIQTLSIQRLQLITPGRAVFADLPEHRGRISTSLRLHLYTPRNSHHWASPESTHCLHPA